MTLKFDLFFIKTSLIIYDYSDIWMIYQKYKTTYFID